MNEEKFRRRGWICACLAPIACVLFLLGQQAGLWELRGEHPVVTMLAGILVVEMLVGTVAPFWWLLTAFRQRKGLRDQPRLQIYANIFALLVSLFFFF